MTLESQLAAVFIHDYKTVLLEIAGSQHQDLPVLNQLTLAWDKLVRDPSLLDTALTSLKQKRIEVDVRAIAALRSLKVKRWIYCIRALVKAMHVRASFKLSSTTFLMPNVS